MLQEAISSFLDHAQRVRQSQQPQHGRPSIVFFPSILISGQILSLSSLAPHTGWDRSSQYSHFRLLK